MRALGDPARAGLAAAAFVAFAGAFAGVPLGARGANAPVAMTSATPAARRDSGPAVVLPRRDPFAGGLANVRANAAPAPRQPATLEPVTRIPAALVPLPPNGNGALPAPAFGGSGTSAAGMRVTGSSVAGCRGAGAAFARTFARPPANGSRRGKTTAGPESRRAAGVAEVIATGAFAPRAPRGTPANAPANATNAAAARPARAGSPSARIGRLRARRGEALQRDVQHGGHRRVGRVRVLARQRCDVDRRKDG